MKSPQLMPSGGNKQTGFTDEYCRMLIDQELAQITIRKTLNAFRNLLRTFHCISTVFIVRMCPSVGTPFEHVKVISLPLWITLKT